MGSEGPPAITVHVTGFKKFHGVAENPTETIVSNLKEFAKRRGLCGGVTLGSCTVLEAAGDGGLPKLYEIMESAMSGPYLDSLSNERVIWLLKRGIGETKERKSCDNSKDRDLCGVHVWNWMRIAAIPLFVRSFVATDACRRNQRNCMLHLGLNAGALRFAIERQAVNEATFRCPDELGWQPQQVPIVPEDGGISRTRKTSCSTDAIAEFLRKQGYDVALSDDADQFVCNYVYYHSLRFADQRGHKSLLVHVPLFSRIDEDTQMQFVASLLEALPIMY